MVGIIDYNAGNLGSVEKALRFIGEQPEITDSPEGILKYDHLLLPGVGAFGDCIRKLKESGFDAAIKEYINAGRPFLGICLGLQMLFETSEEDNSSKGLGIYKGKVKRFPDGLNLKIPQIGWNSIEINPKSRLFKGINSGEHLYFVHSYYLDADDKDIVAAQCSYGVNFDAAIECGNVFATQFHPEKSGDVGLRVLKNFVSNI